MSDPAPTPRRDVRLSVATALLGFAGLVAAALAIIVGLLYAGHRLQH